MQGLAEVDAEKRSLKQRLDSLRSYLGPVFLNAFSDPTTIEMILNPDGVLWQECLGEKLKPIGRMKSWHAGSAMNIVATCLGKELTYNTPTLEGEFPLDGSRFAGQIPPAVANPAFAIRKKASSIFTLDEYVVGGILTPAHRAVIAEMVHNHRNILVLGGTSSGKTTLTNAVIHEIVHQNDDERILIIEDTGELQCAAKNSVTYHTTPTCTMTDLVKATLRMRPDRIIVGEVRDHAALDVLDAWNTGHEGGVATFHANNVHDGLLKYRSLVSRNEFAPKDIERVIASVVHCIVHISKVDAGRQVKAILRVDGWDDRTHQYNWTEL